MRVLTRPILSAALMLAGAAVETQAQAQVAQFVITRALPAGRAFSFAIVSGVAGNAAYDTLKEAMKPAPAPSPPPAVPPAPAPPSAGGVGGLAGPPNAAPPLIAPPSSLDRPALGFDNPCRFASRCSNVERLLSDLEKLAPPSAPGVAAPPAAAPRLDCLDDRIDGSTALQRAVNLDQGTPPPRNAPAARQCYAVAARHGLPIAQFSLADMLMRGDDGVPQDRPSALGHLRSAAAAGFIPAQLRLAEAYEYAEGTPTDLVAAEGWYRRAAEVGSASAQYRLSSLHYHGRGGVARDWPQALFWLQLSLRQGYGPARSTMPSLLDSLGRAAEAGNPEALNTMGIVYEYGVAGLVAPDTRRAVRDYRAAGNLGGVRRLCSRDPAVCG